MNAIVHRINIAKYRYYILHISYVKKGSKDSYDVGEC